MADPPRNGDILQGIVGLKYPFPHLMRSLKDQRNTKIVAIGSSSTAGEGDIVPYPARFELLLRGDFRDRMINVINRGVGGEEATIELPRIKSDVIDEAPAMVIWQVGTNAVFRNQEFDFEKVVSAIASGLDLLKTITADVMLMDLQYTTAVVKPDKKELADKMVQRISDVAKEAKVNVFRRYSLMQHWQDVLPMKELIDPTDPDKLHMSEWATKCVTQVLYNAIADAPPTV